MFSSIISLHTTNWYKRTKLFTDLLALSIGAIYSLALFIRFGGFTCWIYLLTLFIGFIYSIWWPYLLDLSIAFSFSVYRVHPRSILIFSQLSKEHLYKVIYRFIGFSYWRYLFIGFIYSLWWLYLLDLSIAFVHWLYLFIGFIYSIWWLYLLGLPIDFSFSVYSFHPRSILIFTQLSKEHLYSSLTIHISRSHGKNLSPSLTSSLFLN